MADDSFKDRQKGYEAKYKLDEEKRFKVESRRNRLVGEWAAGKLGLSGDAVKTYVTEVIRSDFEQPGPDDVVRKVLGDFQKKNVAVSEADVRTEMERLYGTAVEQINKEVPSSL